MSGLKCPNCGAKPAPVVYDDEGAPAGEVGWWLVEDVPSYRALAHVEGDYLVFDEAHLEDVQAGHDPRLVCGTCYTQVPIPDEVRYDVGP